MAESTSTASRLAELDNVADRCARLEIVAEFRFDMETRTALILGRGKTKWIDIYTPEHWFKKSMSEAMRSVTASFGAGATALVVESITVKASKAPLKAKELKALIVDAYCEACGIRKPSSEELEAKIESANAATADATTAMLAELRGGPEGIKHWNARPWDRGKRAALEECDLSGCELPEVTFNNVSLDGSNLSKVLIRDGILSGTNMMNTNLQMSQFLRTNLTEGSMMKADFSESAFDKVQIYRTSFLKANFSSTRWRDVSATDANFINCLMNGIDLEDCTIESSKFCNAVLTESNFVNCELIRNNFSEGIASGARFVGCNFQGSNFQHACLTGTSFVNCNLTVVDLRGADLTGALLPVSNIFEKTVFDETTKFPDGFEPPLAMAWKGPGPHPYKLLEFKRNTPAAPVEFPEFMKRVSQAVDKSRFDKVLTMLKADRFQLFAKVESSMVLGVVRSQTDAELVYGCKLCEDGTFCCCTQNLNACGGLRGQVCKHILVLVIGLVKAEELNPTNADTWTRASAMYKPKLDRDEMAELFIQYAGAQAGDIDWRPTETIPEDYYAF